MNRIHTNDSEFIHKYVLLSLADFDISSCGVAVVAKPEV
jgi:hypothetical protein